VVQVEALWATGRTGSLPEGGTESSRDGGAGETDASRRAAGSR
jgi:hypothetical protein